MTQLETLTNILSDEDESTVLKKSMSRLSQAYNRRIPAEVSSSCLTVR